MNVGMSLTAIVIQHIIEQYEPICDLVSELLRCLRPLEKVVQGHLFFSLFIMNIGQAERSLKGHLFDDRVYSTIS